MDWLAFCIEDVCIGVLGHWSIWYWSFWYHGSHSAFIIINFYFYFLYFLLKACAFDDFFATEDARVSFWTV